MSSLGAVVLVPTSMPTWHMMPMNESRTMGLPSSTTQSFRLEALPAWLSSGILVAKSNMVAATPITMYMGKSMRQP